MFPLEFLLAAPPPQGVGYAWSPPLLWLSVMSDAGIALAYFSIPVSLAYVLRKRTDGPFNWVVTLFGLFIVCCGTTHVFEIIAVWRPVYWEVGVAKAITAVISIVTAILLVPFLPRVLRLPNPIVDPVTGLPNRVLFVDRLAQAVERLRRHPERTFAVLFLDLDRFKAINDRFGHAAGDEVLRAVGRRLSSVLRPIDTVARLGGDEFTILLEDVEDAAQTRETTRRLLATLDRPFEFAGAQVHVGASAGVVLNGRPGLAAQLLADADAAMYRAKARGHGSIELVVHAPPPLAHSLS